jgi:hypothetical protein
LDIDIEAKKSSNENNNIIFEEFLKSKVGEIDKLYSTLQDKSISIADLKLQKQRRSLYTSTVNEIIN